MEGSIKKIHVVLILVVIPIKNPLCSPSFQENLQTFIWNFFYISFSFWNIRLRRLKCPILYKALGPSAFSFVSRMRVSVREKIESTKKFGGLTWLTKIWDDATKHVHPGSCSSQETYHFHRTYTRFSSPIWL